jgi:hypothetical protein
MVPTAEDDTARTVVLDDPQLPRCRPQGWPAPDAGTKTLFRRQAFAQNARGELLKDLATLVGIVALVVAWWLS